eukprot:UN16815
METTYLQESNQFRSVLKGFESFLSSYKNTANLKRSRKFQVDERLFSLSSVTSPAVEEQLAARDEAREYAGRSKGASTPANGQGKPKKGGRPGGRDGKRIRPSSDPDLDDEDDY